MGANTATSPEPFTVLVAPIVTPGSAASFPKQTLTLTSTQPAQWRVGLVVGGNASLGTITTAGTTATYTAPAAVPPGGLVTVTAANLDDLLLQGTATVEVFAPTDRLRTVPVSVARAPTATPLPAALVAVAREPVVTAVLDPATGQPARFPAATANQNVVLRGAGFSGASAVAFTGLTGSPDGGVTVNSFAVASSTHITANITIPSGTPAGVRVARVTAGGVTSPAPPTGANSFEVLP